MAADDQAPLDDEPDPTEDTPAPEGEDTTTADDQPGSDQDAQRKEAQAEFTRQAQRAALQQRADEQEQRQEATAAAAEAAQNDDLLERATQDSWALAETIHGTEAMDAYRVAARLVNAAATPADWVTAFEAYHEIRSGKPAGATSGSTKPTRAEAVQPKVDSNRSEPGPDLAKADEKLAEARKGKSLSDFTNAAAARLGFLPGKS